MVKKQQLLSYSSRNQGLPSVGSLAIPRRSLEKSQYGLSISKAVLPPNLSLKFQIVFIYGTKTKFCIWNEPPGLLDMVTTTKWI